MKTYLLPQEGHFYKANLHTHTTISDGRLSPQEIKQAYQEKGYSILALTDHCQYRWHRELDSKDFLTLAAYEVDINEIREDSDLSRKKVYHFNLYDTNPAYRTDEKILSPCPGDIYGDLDAINCYLKQMEELGFLICYNHPYWSLQSREDFIGLDHIFAMEIFNYGCEHDGLYGYHPQCYDEALRSGKHWFCLSTDDNHNEFPFDHPFCDSFGGFTMIKCRELSYSCVIEALRQGHFYASSGPEIEELTLENNVLSIKTSSVEKIFVITETRNCHRAVACSGGTLSGAQFELDGNEGYFRVVCQDMYKRFASTNAFFLP